MQNTRPTRPMVVETKPNQPKWPFSTKTRRLFCLICKNKVFFVSILEANPNIYCFYMSKLLLFWWNSCGNYWQFKVWVAKANKLFACLIKSYHILFHILYHICHIICQIFIFMLSTFFSFSSFLRSSSFLLLSSFCGCPHFCGCLHS